MKSINNVSELNAGDLVRGKASGRTYRVIAVYGDRATAVDVQDICNPSEWIVLDEPNELKSEMIGALKVNNQWLKKLVESNVFNHQGIEIIVAGIKSNESIIAKAEAQ